MENVKLNGTVKKKTSFLNQVNKESNQQLLHCYQCGKCSAGCPVTMAMDYLPHQVIRMVQLGLKEEVLKSQSIWICAGCSTCSVRCPRNIELSEIMDALRIMAQREGVHPPERGRRVQLFNKNFLDSLKKYGRLHEFKTMLSYNIESGNPFQDTTTGITMLSKGKLKFNIKRPSGTDEISRIFSKIDEMEENK